MELEVEIDTVSAILVIMWLLLVAACPQTPESTKYFWFEHTTRIYIPYILARVSCLSPRISYMDHEIHCGERKFKFVLKHKHTSCIFSLFGFQPEIDTHDLKCISCVRHVPLITSHFLHGLNDDERIKVSSLDCVPHNALHK